MKLDRLDHIAVATWSIPGAYRLFHDALGGRFVNGGDNDELQIRTLQLAMPNDIKIELLQPLADTSYLHRYLTKHGEGFHHMTMVVDDVTQAVAELPAAGYELVDTNLNSANWRETFIRPRDGIGTLIQIVDTVRDWNTPDPRFTSEDVMAGVVVWVDEVPQRREDS